MRGKLKTKLQPEACACGNTEMEITVRRGIGALLSRSFGGPLPCYVRCPQCGERGIAGETVVEAMNNWNDPPY